MDYYCDLCDKFIKAKSKYKHFKGNIHKEFDRCKHIELTSENPNVNDIDEIFYAYFNENYKRFEYYFIKCHFKLVFNDNQFSTYIKSNLLHNKNNGFLKDFFRKSI